MFNFHGYRTWMPDHARGYTRHKEGILAPDAELAEHYHRRANFPKVVFDTARQKIVVETIREVCCTINLQLYYAVCESTHAHGVVAWTDRREWTVCYDRIKRIIGFKLAKAEGVIGRRWLAGKVVRDIDHLRQLMVKYLPGHRGISWVDRDVLARVYTRGD